MAAFDYHGYRVDVDQHYYSVPHALVGHEMWARYTAATVQCSSEASVSPATCDRISAAYISLCVNSCRSCTWLTLSVAEVPDPVDPRLASRTGHWSRTCPVSNSIRNRDMAHAWGF